MKSNLLDDNLFIFWAKTSHASERLPRAYHPLLCHMIDVAVVTLLMGEKVLSKAAKKRIARSLGLSTDKEGLELAGRIVAWIAGLHDLGKASPPFALRGVYEKGRQTYKLLDLYDEKVFGEKKTGLIKEAKCAPHGFVTASELPKILCEDFGFSSDLANCIATMIGGHHGIFPSSGHINDMSLQACSGKQAWRDARRKLALALRDLLGVPKEISSLTKSSLDNATTMILTGLVSVADWIGSNTEFFKCEVEDFTKEFSIDPEGYLQKAERQAREALTTFGWLGWSEQNSPTTFANLFPLIETPRHLQTTSEKLAEGTLQSSGIVIVEAPMGEGKTEAAMFLADHWNAVLNQRGCYFALPTQATSNQMYERVKDFLERRFPEANVPLQLLHGHASLSAEFLTSLDEGKKLHTLMLQGIYDEDTLHKHDDGCTPNVVAAEWFTYRKRGLLAPFGVGTIDQALMSVLQTKHVFVRLFGLSHKTIIIDEVHAYDAYMSTLLERLLEWLAALQSPVVLLSATLPKQKRDALLRAYRRGLEGDENVLSDLDKEVTYPRISWATKDKSGVIVIDTSKQNTRTLYLEKIDESKPLAERLKEALKDGGCAAVICNTVKRAQEVYQILSEDPFFQGNASDDLPKLDLLHARFRYCDREKREQRTCDRFGKPDKDGNNINRPDRAVLISTQIIEQSLDLDFDLMVTDLAPVDLILQRAGRLQRHNRKTRPKRFDGKPTLWICEPQKDADGVPKFVHRKKIIYDKHILLRSWLALRGKGQIEIPGEIENLIEFVYDTRKPCFDESLKEQWDNTQRQMTDELRKKKANAKTYRFTSPNDADLFEAFNLELAEDSPEKDATLQARTRDDEMPSVSVVILLPEESNQFDLSIKPEC